jgi:hypothetical protein
MNEHITHVAFDMHQDSITAAWLFPVKGDAATFVTLQRCPPIQLPMPAQRSQ